MCWAESNDFSAANLRRRDSLHWWIRQHQGQLSNLLRPAVRSNISVFCGFCYSGLNKSFFCSCGASIFNAPPEVVTCPAGMYVAFSSAHKIVRMFLSAFWRLWTFNRCVKITTGPPGSVLSSASLNGGLDCSKHRSIFFVFYFKFLWSHGILEDSKAQNHIPFLFEEKRSNKWTLKLCWQLQGVVDVFDECNIQRLGLCHTIPSTAP